MLWPEDDNGQEVIATFPPDMLLGVNNLLICFEDSLESPVEDHHRSLDLTSLLNLFDPLSLNLVALPEGKYQTIHVTRSTWTRTQRIKLERISSFDWSLCRLIANTAEPVDIVYNLGSVLDPARDSPEDTHLTLVLEEIAGVDDAFRLDENCALVASPHVNFIVIEVKSIAHLMRVFAPLKALWRICEAEQEKQDSWSARVLFDLGRERLVRVRVFTNEEGVSASALL